MRNKWVEEEIKRDTLERVRNLNGVSSLSSLRGLRGLRNPNLKVELEEGGATCKKKC